MSEQSQPAGEEPAESVPRAAGRARDKVAELLARRGRIKVSTSPKAPAAAPVAPAAPVKARGGDKQTLSELQSELASLRELRESMQSEREAALLAKRVDYARRSGLHSGISDDVAAAVMGRFDLDTAKGKAAFEDFRRANPAMFADTRTMADVRSEVAKRQEKAKPKNSLFGKDFVRNNLERNLR